MSEPRILLVDDEQDIAEALSFALASDGYEVEIANDGEAGYRSALQNPPDLLILDVMLPGINGYEISRQLKDWMKAVPSGKDFPILLITARRIHTPQREEFLSVWSRADAVLYKPFELNDLTRRVEELLTTVIA
jgi:DNA-binding response OmpR family regulator